MKKMIVGLLVLSSTAAFAGNGNNGSSTVRDLVQACVRAGNNQQGGAPDAKVEVQCTMSTTTWKRERGNGNQVTSLPSNTTITKVIRTSKVAAAINVVEVNEEGRSLTVRCPVFKQVKTTVSAKKIVKCADITSSNVNINTICQDKFDNMDEDQIENRSRTKVVGTYTPCGGSSSSTGSSK